MQWSKAKTIMIWVFLIVDIILVATFTASRISSRHSDIKLLTKILADNNLNVREEILETKLTDIFACEFTGITLSEELAEIFLDSPVMKDSFTYESKNGKSFLHSESMRIFYENPSPSLKGFSKVTEKNIHAKLSYYLKKLGIYNHVKLTSVYKENEDIYAQYTYFYNDMEIFNSDITFKVNEKGIKKIDGVINIPNKKSGYNFTLSNLDTILLNFVQNNKFVSPVTVVSITPGYYCPGYDNTVLSQAIPVYRIKTTDRIFIYDARDGIDSQKRQLLNK